MDPSVILVIDDEPPESTECDETSHMSDLKPYNEYTAALETSELLSKLLNVHAFMNFMTDVHAHSSK